MNHKPYVTYRHVEHAIEGLATPICADQESMERVRNKQLGRTLASAVGLVALTWLTTLAATLPAIAEQGISTEKVPTDPLDPSRSDLSTDCDRLAAAPTDAGRAPAIAGVRIEAIAIVPAMMACIEATHQYPISVPSI